MEDKKSDRQSIRLDEYDYASQGAYFITICVQHKQHRFGYIIDGTMHLNEAGQMIEERILAIAVRFPDTLIDSYVVMPNHVHFIISLLGNNPNGSHVGAPHRGCPLSDRQGRASSDDNNVLTSVPDGNVSSQNIAGGHVGPKAGGHDGPPLHNNDVVRDLPSVADVVGWFKASTTNYYVNGVKVGHYPAFDKRLWQRNYYEHIIRTEAAYNQINEYIRTNPER